MPGKSDKLSAAHSTSKKAKPVSAVAALKTKRGKMYLKQQIHTHLTRDIAYKPINRTTGSGIPRSLFQQDPLLKGSQDLHDKRSKQSPVDTNLSTSTLFNNSPQTNETKQFTAQEKQEIAEIVNLFSPEMLDKHPILKIAAAYAQQGEWERAKDSLITATKTLEIELDMDDSAKPIFDPTKHENFAQAMGEFIFKEDTPSITHTAAMKLQIQGGDLDQMFGKKKDRAIDESKLLEDSHTAQENSFKKKSIFNGVFSGRTQATPSTQQQHASISSPSQQKQKKTYVSSPPLPSNMPQTPEQWDKLTHRYKKNFESFQTPSFLDPRQHPTNPYLADDGTLASARRLTKSGQNPFYLPNGKLNVRWIQEFAPQLQEEHSKLIDPKDIKDVMMILQNIDSSPDFHQADMNPQELRDSIARGDITEEQVKNQRYQQTAPNQADIRAAEAFGSLATMTGAVPSTQQLLSRNSVEFQRKYAIDKSKIDIEVGYPFLTQLQSIVTMTPDEREELGKNPLYGSLSLLTPFDIETIKKEYDFTDPNDVAQYITRFLGRTSSEVDHRYNIPRAEFEAILAQYAEKQVKNQDIKEMIQYKKRLDAAMKAELGDLSTPQYRSDDEDELRLEEKFGGAENLMKHKIKELMDNTHGKPSRDGNLVMTDGMAGQNGDKIINMLSELGNDHKSQMMFDFNEWQRGVKDYNNPLQPVRGLGGILAAPMKAIQQENEEFELMRRAFGDDDDPHEDERVKAFRNNIRNRREFEDKLPDHALAHFRAKQIAMKSGHDKDWDWTHNKAMELFHLIKYYKKNEQVRNYRHIRTSPEDRAEHVLTKTLQKYQHLYEKYLPKPAEDADHTHRMAMEMKQMTRGDEAQEILLKSQQKTIELIRQKEEHRQQVDGVLRERQEALLRRSREIQLVERRMELQAAGLSRQEIDNVLELEQINRRERGVDTESIIKKQMDDRYNDSARGTPLGVESLLATDPAKLDPSKNLPTQDDWDANGVKRIPLPAKSDNEPLSLPSTIAVVDSNTQETPKATPGKSSLLDRVRKRKLVKEFEDKQASGDIIVDPNGIIQISRESFQKQIEIEQAKKDKDRQQQFLQNQAKVSDEVLRLIEQEEHGRMQKLEAIREQQELLDNINQKSSKAADLRKEKLKQLFGDDWDKEDNNNTQGPSSGGSTDPIDVEYQHRNELFKALAQTNEQEEVTLKAMLGDEYVPMYNRPLPVKGVSHQYFAIASEDEEHDAKINNQKIPDHLILREEFTNRNEDMLDDEHDKLQSRYQNHLHQQMEQEQAKKRIAERQAMEDALFAFDPSHDDTATADANSNVDNLDILENIVVSGDHVQNLAENDISKHSVKNKKQKQLERDQQRLQKKQQLENELLSSINITSASIIEHEFSLKQHEADEKLAAEKKQAEEEAAAAVQEDKAHAAEEVAVQEDKAHAAEEAAVQEAKAHAAEEARLELLNKLQAEEARMIEEREQIKRRQEVDLEKLAAQHQELSKASNSKKQHASALDAFFNADEGFDTLFKADATHVQKNKNGKEKDIADQLFGEDSDEHTENANHGDFIDIEGGAAKKGLIEGLVDISPPALNAEPRFVKKSDTLILSKINKKALLDDIVTEPSVIDAILDNEDYSLQSHEAHRQRALQAQLPLEKLIKTTQQQEAEFQPQMLSISALSQLSSTAEQHVAAVKDFSDTVKQQTSSVFQKLQDSQKQYERFEELKNQAREEGKSLEITSNGKPLFKKRSLGLVALQEQHDKDLNELREKKSQDAKDDLFPSINPARGGRRPLTELTETITAARASTDQIVDFVIKFRRALGLPDDPTIRSRDPFHGVTLLEDDLLADFYTSMAASAAATTEEHEKNPRTGNAKPSQHLHESLAILRTNDDAAYRLIMSILYYNGGKEMVAITHALRKVQEMVMSGQIKDLTSFQTALVEAGLDQKTIQGLQPSKLFEDLEAEKLGLDDGGNLMDDDGSSPIVQDPLDDYVKNADRPLYSSKTTDLRLVAAMKRKERSTVFKDLDEAIEEDLAREIMDGVGIFKALSDEHIGANAQTTGRFFQLSDKISDNRYKSTGPAYDPNDPKSQQFDSFFDAPSEKSNGKLFGDQKPPEQRRSILAGFLTGKQDKVALQQATKHQSQLRLQAPNYHDLLSTEDLAQLDIGIKQRLERLVDRISRHTLLSPALILQKMEDPKQFAKLLSLLTPEMVQEMSLVDKLLDNNKDMNEKRMLMEMADVRSPRQLSNKQTWELAPDFQGDLDEFKGEFQNVQRTLVFKEDQDRQYLKGFLDPGYLKLDDPNRPVTTQADIDAGRDPAAEYDEQQRQKRIAARNEMNDVKTLSTTSLDVDVLVEGENVQKSLLDTVQDAMAEKDAKLQEALLISQKDTKEGPDTRKLITDMTLSKPHPLSTRRKLQLTRLKVDEARELLEQQKRVQVEFLQRINDIRTILARGEFPLVDAETKTLRAIDGAEAKKLGLLAPDFKGTSSMLPAIASRFGRSNIGQLAVINQKHLVSEYDLNFAAKELEKYSKGDDKNAVSELLNKFFDPATTQDDLAELATAGAGTSVGRLYNMFSPILPRLPHQTKQQLELQKFFKREGAAEETMNWMEGLRNDLEKRTGDPDGHLGDERISSRTEIGAMVRKSWEEMDLSTLSPEIRAKVESSKKELELAFEDYRKIEVMLDRQLRLFHLEKDRESLGLPDFNQLNLLKHKFEVILSSLQNPGITSQKKQKLMEDAREVMAQMIAIRNLKENDPELYYWNIFLAKIPPEYHTNAINCHNMPIDPMRLFDDLNPTGDLSLQETLENVLRFIFENQKDTKKLFHHIELRSTNAHPGSPTMTMRDLRKEQLVCKRMLTLKRTMERLKMDTKQILRKEMNDQYMHQLRVLRMKELMDEPDVAEVQRQKLEFWLDQSHQRGKKAGLNNVLIQDVQDNMDLPVGALNGNATTIVAHKKMLKRRKGEIDPVLYNGKTSRMFSNDRLNPMNQYGRVLALRKERRRKGREKALMENELHPTEIAAINAAREGNRLLSYLGTHGAGSNNINVDIKDLLQRQQHLLVQQKQVLLLNATGRDIKNKNEKRKNRLNKSISQESDEDNDESDAEANTDENENGSDHQKLKALGLDSPAAIDEAWENLPAIHQERKRVIDKQLTQIGFQLSQLVAKKQDFEATQHIRHDGKDVSLVHVANQPFVYARVVASYGQTVVVEQCGSNAYMRHSQYFVQDELEQIKRAAGDVELQLSNRDNLDDGEIELDENGNPTTLLMTKEQLEEAENLKKARSAIRGNRRRWHCHKSRHMDLLTGDYVFIDPAPGRAWNSAGTESTAQTTVNSMNATGAGDHGVVKAVFNRLNQIAKGSRSQNKLNHLEEANPICSNSDHLVILCAAEGQPAFSTALIDKYLASASYSGVNATIVYNKIDLIAMVDEAEKVLKDLKDKRATLHEKEKTLRKKLGKKGFRQMKRKLLKDQKKQLRDTHFYTATMQRYHNKLLYSEALARELVAMDNDDDYEQLKEEQRNITHDDIYEEDPNGCISYKKAAPIRKLASIDYSVPTLVKRHDDPKSHAIDYYYNDEEYDDDEEERVLLEQQLEKWISKKKRQVSREVEDQLREYERLGIKVIRMSSKTGAGMDELEQLLSRFHTTSFVGQSGAGKSTILNALIPDLDLQTSNVSVEGKGTHTTTTSRMFHLPNGGSVIDTPGSQSFVPPAVEPEFVQDLFPEIKALSQFCKLGCRCNHLSEVGCAVREAVGDGSNRAYIPVTITELFDPSMMNNMRVAEFRARLESGELRDLAMNRPGNDPVLLYAQQYYQDADAGKINGPYRDVYIPTETGVHLGGDHGLDEQGSTMLHAREEASLMNSTNQDDLERHPAHVVPLEESDFERDGTEQPYHIRKDKHAIRELRELIVLKQEHMGMDVDNTAEYAEIQMLQTQVEKQLKHWRNNRLRARGLPVYDDDLTTEESEEPLPPSEDEKIPSGDEFDFNFAYDIEAMTNSILEQQSSNLVMNNENLNQMIDNVEGFKDEIRADARETAKAMARIDLRDRYEAFKQKQHDKQERKILEFRAHRLGITVEKLLELQEKIQKEKAQLTAKSQESSQQQSSLQTEPIKPTNKDITDKNKATASYNDHGEYIPPTMRHLSTHNTLIESTIVDDDGNEFIVEDKNNPLEKQMSVTTATNSQINHTKKAEEEYRMTFNKNIDPADARRQLDLLDGGLANHEDSPQMAEFRQSILDGILDRHAAMEAVHRESTVTPTWRKERDKLTQRRFGSKLPADSNAYVPEFRYKSYLALYELMTKTKEHLQKRKKKSLTRQEEDKIKWREQKEKERDQRDLRRRRLLVDEDPYGTRGDLVDKQLRSFQQDAKNTLPLEAGQQDWLDTKLKAKLGVIEDPRISAKIKLLEESSTKTLSTKKRGIREFQDEVSLMMNERSAVDDKEETQGFTHSMLAQMRDIYDERKVLTRHDEEGGLENTHAEHWRRTGKLKQTWKELEALQAKSEKLGKMQQAHELTKQHTGGHRNTYGDRAMMEQQCYTDDEDENQRRRAQYYGDPTTIAIMDKFDTTHSLLDKNVDPYENITWNFRDPKM